MANKYSDEDVLQLSYEIIQLIEQNIMYFTDEETESVLMSNESMGFHVENDNMDRAI